MQIIMATAFATDIDSQTNPDSTLNVRASQCLHLSPFAIITGISKFGIKYEGSDTTFYKADLFRNYEDRLMYNVE